MKILVVSGFLGAGKTTFIKELIRKTGENLVIMENEFGETNLDSRELAKTSELEILEFMEGCVCCTMKDSFVNSILTVSASLDPKYLVVEPTGVGMLGSILENVQKVCYEKISLLKPVVVLTPRSFLANLRDYPDIYLDQIKNAAVIVFSKAENEMPEIIDDTTARIREINPYAEIVQDHYSGRDISWWTGLLRDENDREAVTDALDDVDLDEVSIRSGHLDSVSELIVLLDDILHGDFGKIIRAKGILMAGNEAIRFDLADGLYGIIGENSEDAQTQCVFIGSELRTDLLFNRLHTSRESEDHEHEGHHHHHGHGNGGHHHHHEHEHLIM